MTDTSHSPFGPYSGEWERERGPAPGMESAEGGPFSPDVTLWKRPRRRFVLVTASGIEDVHEGADLTLDMVLRFYFPNVNEVDTSLGVTYDLAIFEGERLAAVVTRGDGFKPIIRRIIRPA